MAKRKKSGINSSYLDNIEVVDEKKQALDKLEAKENVRALEQFYADGTFEDMETLVEMKKEEVVRQLESFRARCTVTTIDKHGIPHETLRTNPIIISSYFFKTLNPISNVEPRYSAEKLGIVWDLYMYLIEQVNIEITDFNPTLTHFCKFAGISTSTLDKYKNSPDESMQYIVKKICDSCYDTSLSMAQEGRIKESSTIFRAKSELGVTEKVTPNVNVNVGVKADLSEIQARLAEYKKLNFKKSN